MFCAKCGHENADHLSTCAACGTPLQSVPNHLVWAILSTLFCCIFTGVVAIVYAAQVNGKVQAGDLAGARQASDNAKLWSWISFGLGLFGLLVYFGLVFLGVMAEYA